MKGDAAYQFEWKGRRGGSRAPRTGKVSCRTRLAMSRNMVGFARTALVKAHHAGRSGGVEYYRRQALPELRQKGSRRLEEGYQRQNSQGRSELAEVGRPVNGAEAHDSQRTPALA